MSADAAVRGGGDSAVRADTGDGFEKTQIRELSHPLPGLPVRYRVLARRRPRLDGVLPFALAARLYNNNCLCYCNVFPQITNAKPFQVRTFHVGLS